MAQAQPRLHPKPARSASGRERALLACGVAGPIVFVVAFLVEGATRPGYSALRHPVSSLALGEYGWTQRANFLLTGLLLLAFAVGSRPALRRAYAAGIWVPLLLGAVAVGLLGAGIFATDPVGDYPPGTAVPAPQTITGNLHDSFSALVFLGLPLACCVAGYRFARAGRRGLAVYSVATAVVFWVLFFLSSAGFSQQTALAPVGGLFQRLTLVVGLGWIGWLALHLLRGGAGAPSRTD
ncbi:DUF998 domain-containing protein [Actinopolymorpha cephalotaxi]|uniref:Membrane protein n=2 Tax=Actinopolymorpha cephalotaxi TaxID=504797 RepID=A0ABX2SCS0_9ACTN|nr:DUF998 domain-containing protein [Actinopolymorpha cephalotaxi]NYH86357.1 putative membrane protein [Actinopolymorpha cephalotaxi]